MATDRALLAHLFRRAGFGARPGELDYYAARPYEEAVDDLVAARPLGGGPVWTSLAGTPADPVADVGDEGVVQIQAGWLERMVRTPTPLVERATLFLHDHFATELRGGEISVKAMLAQHRRFRSHALGDFAALTHEMIEDVALGHYLDHFQNRRGNTNENFARELMELFTVGEGAYGESDVREAARALTGYRLVDNSTDPMGAPTRAEFDPARHDPGPKVVLGRRERYQPHDLVNLLLDHPASRRHLAVKLVAAFGDPRLPGLLVGAVERSLRAKRWNLAEALRTIFLSAQFRDRGARGHYVRQPAEFVAAGMRALNIDDWRWGAYRMSETGQMLYQPPNVGGWIGGDWWLAPNLVLARYNTAVEFGWRADRTTVGADPAAWLAAFGIAEVGAATRAALDAYMSSTAKVAPEQRAAGLVTLIVASPEFSLA